MAGEHGLNLVIRQVPQCYRAAEGLLGVTRGCQTLAVRAESKAENTAIIGHEPRFHRSGAADIPKHYSVRLAARGEHFAVHIKRDA